MQTPLKEDTSPAVLNPIELNPTAVLIYLRIALVEPNKPIPSLNIPSDA